MDKQAEKYVIGIDFGSDSVRAVVVNATDGTEVSSAVSFYSRWKAGKYCDSLKFQYRQHPLDYIEALQLVVKEALLPLTPAIIADIAGLAFDTTGSTPVLVDKEGTPLALLPQFAEEPDAMFVLWKDHTAIREANEINSLSKKWDIDYTAYSGGTYSSEWVWSKVLHLLRNNAEIRSEAYSWMEHCDWMTALLSGDTTPEKICRSRCAAAHKAMWNERWDGLPSEEFLTTLDPLLSGYRDRLFTETYTTDQIAGKLSSEWAGKLGLRQGIPIAIGAIDAHVGAVGACIKPNVLTRIMGTSTCDIVVSSKQEIGDRLIAGICGQADGSVIPGYIGMEAGQSAFGDVYAWFRDILTWPLQHILTDSLLINDQTKQALIDETMQRIIPELSIQAAAISPKQSSVFALDWLNGRRTPDANQLLKGAICGLTLGSTAPMIFRALVEATAFGSKAIVECFEKEGVQIHSIIAIGGISQKSPFVMQTLADVLNMPIRVIKSEQTCALGAAMFAAVAGGIYTTIEEAQSAMGSGFLREYTPEPGNSRLYQKLYTKYKALATFAEQTS